MATTTTLTIRIDVELKRQLEAAAREADQSVTDYMVRAVKLRMGMAAERGALIEQFLRMQKRVDHE